MKALIFDKMFLNEKSSYGLEDYSFIFTNSKNELFAIMDNFFYDLNSHFEITNSYPIESDIYPDFYYYCAFKNLLIGYCENELYYMRPKILSFSPFCSMYHKEPVASRKRKQDKICISYDQKQNHIYISDKKENIVKKYKYGQPNPTIIEQNIASPQSIYFQKDILWIFSQAENSLIARDRKKILKTFNFSKEHIIKASFFINNYFYYYKNNKLNQFSLESLRRTGEKPIDFIPKNIFQYKEDIVIYG